MHVSQQHRFPRICFCNFSVMAELEEGNSLCRREAGWVFLNMCECGVDVGESIIPDIVSHGVISAICHNLDDDAEPGELSFCKAAV